jgi:hypothetical protein
VNEAGVGEHRVADAAEQSAADRHVARRRREAQP